MTKGRIVPGIEAAIQEALEATGNKESPPNWTKVPDCPCFRAMPETRGEIIDLTVHALRESIELAINDAGACDKAAHAFIGALLVSVAGAVFESRFQEPGRESATVFNMTDDEKLVIFRLLEDSYHNARDRVIDMFNHYDGKRVNN